MNAKTAESFFLGVREEWGIDELVGLLGKGFASELQLGPGSDNGLKELEAKVREGLGEVGDSCDTAGVRRGKDVKKELFSFEDTRRKSRSPGRCVDYQP